MTTHQPTPETYPQVEEVLFHGRTHPKILAGPVLAQIVLSTVQVLTWRYWPESLGTADTNHKVALVVHGVLVGLMVYYAVIPILRWRHSTFEVTNRRVRARWGVLYKHSREIHLDRITQVAEERGILDRIFRCGTIVVYDAANASGAIRFHDVPRFHQVRQVIDDARHAAHRAVQIAPPGVTPGPGPGQW